MKLTFVNIYLKNKPFGEHTCIDNADDCIQY